MTTSVLVAYATKYGSTQEIAEAVGAVLREHGLRTEVRPVREVRTLDGYSAEQARLRDVVLCAEQAPAVPAARQAT